MLEFEWISNGWEPLPAEMPMEWALRNGFMLDLDGDAWITRNFDYFIDELLCCATDQIEDDCREGPMRRPREILLTCLIENTLVSFR